MYFSNQNKNELINFDKVLKFIKPKDYDNVYRDELINSLFNDLYKELYNRNFDIEGLECEFSGSLEDNVSSLMTIKHSDFKIFICSTSIGIKYDNRIFEYYTDSSGLTLSVYAGGNWENDKELFYNGYTCNFKLDNKEKTYLNYSCDHNSDVFTFIKDNREYSPEGNERHIISRAEEENRLQNFLISLISNIKSLPEKKFNAEYYIKEKTLLKETLKLVSFNTVNYPEDFKYIQGSNRLIRLGDFVDGPWQDIYNDGFIYCEEDNGQEDKTISEGYSSYSSNYTFRFELELKYSDEIYVLDVQDKENYIKSIQVSNKFNLFGDTNDNSKLSEKEKLKNYNNAKVLKMVHISEYDGTYKKPLYLIRRVIRKDEIKSAKRCKEKNYNQNIDLLTELLEI